MAFVVNKPIPKILNPDPKILKRIITISIFKNHILSLHLNNLKIFNFKNAFEN